MGAWHVATFDQVRARELHILNNTAYILKLKIGLPSIRRSSAFVTFRETKKSGIL